MEKGFFQVTDGALKDIDIIEDHQIALPNQIPTPKVFATGNHSSALDALILQNEDLLSRLSVNIRRNASLEEDIQQLFDAQQVDRKLIENLKDQIFILRKKDGFISDRHQKSENIQTELNEKIQFLEQKYTEYYSTTEEKIESLITENDKKNEKNQRLIKYSSKISLIANELRHAVKFNTSELKKEEAHLKDVQAQLAEAADHIRTQSRDYDEKIKTITEQYGQEVNAAKVKIKSTEIDIDKLRTQVEKLTYTLEQNFEFKNQIIELKRQVSTLKSTHSNELAEIQRTSSEAKKDLKQKLVENNTLHQDNQSLMEQVDELTSDNAQLKDQVESIQILWSEGQNQTEKLNKQNNSLQNLNQKLSTKLNGQRIELNKLKSQLDQSILESKNKIKQLIEKQRLLQTDQTEASTLEAQKNSANILSKMENLICEIQTGLTPSEQNDV